VNPLDTPIDVVIPVATKDVEMLPLVLQGVRRFVKHKIDHIYLASSPNQQIARFAHEHGCTFVNEDDLSPLPKADIDYICNGIDRSGWLLQQLIKLNADSVCENDMYLALDADTVLIQEHIFFHGKTIFRFDKKYYKPFFRTHELLFNSKPTSIVSYVCHLMLFNVDVLKKFKDTISQLHQCNWSTAILAAIDTNEKSYFSEYESYANFFSQHYKKDMELRYSHNLAIPRNNSLGLDHLIGKYSAVAQSISMHEYRR